MKKILIHLANNTEYISFTRSINANLDQAGLQMLGSALHGQLFEIFYKSKPDIVVLPTNEYTQEFHDFISEYAKNTKIILFTNNLISNNNIVDFWNSNKLIIVGQQNLYTDNKPINFLSYDMLYDSSIYKHLDQPRNSKIAVYLSTDDQKNDSILEPLLYPRTKLKLVLFNSTTYKKSQNIGFIRPEDSCRILNTFSSVLDIDDRYGLEAAVCRIDNIDIANNVLDNINHKILRPAIENYESKSYDLFIKNSFLPTIKDL